MLQHLLSSPVVLPLSAGIVLIALLLLVGRVPLSYNINNLLARWRTTVLTALAFMLVTALLVGMLAFVNGMAELTRNSGQSGNVIILAEGATDESFSNLGFSDVGDIENQPGILRQENRPLVSRETYLVVNQPIENPPPGRPKRRFLQVRGLDDPRLSGAVHAIALHDGGSWFSAAGVREQPGQSQSAIEVVVGEGLARELARDRYAISVKEQLTVGDTFALNERTWVITGVMRSSGMTFDSEVWAKRALVGPMFGKETYSSLVAQAADAPAAQKLRDFFNNEYKKAAVNAQTEVDYFNSLNDTNKQFSYAIMFLTVVIAVGGVFGVMNTMFAAISQRTRDIGVLRLLGFSGPHVLIAFLLESVMIALLGGIAGCLAGCLTHGLTANSIVTSGQGGGKFVVLRLIVDPDTLAKGMLLALAMGVIGGAIPALRTIRLRALDALR